jgi:hypothetical protein
MVGHYTVLHYGERPAISPGSNKCYARMLLPGDTPPLYEPMRGNDTLQRRYDPLDR